MGMVYVVIDSFIKYPTDVIAGVHIDESLQKLNRKELCREMENIYGLDKNVFWELPSTCKIRLGCQFTLKALEKMNTQEMRELKNEGS